MNLSELLEKPQPEYQKAVDLIINNCQPYLNEINNDVINNKLYRGVKIKQVGSEINKYGEGLMLQKSTRTDREPTDMPPDVTKYMDDIFEEHFGHRFRTQAVFTVGGAGTANSYGVPFIVFPIGQFQYLWDWNDKDMFDGKFHVLINNLSKRQASGKTKAAKHFEQKINFYVQTYLLQTRLTDAISKGHEVMIATDYYYLLPARQHLKYKHFKPGHTVLERLQQRLNGN